MLLPDQVVPFLLHADPLVRRHAVRYFQNGDDVGPLTADHYWAVIDRFGETDETLTVASQMPGLPQTESSVRRLAAALAPGAASDPYEFHYQHAARDVPLDALVRHGDLLLAVPALLPHVRRHLELRLSLVGQPTDALYDRLMDRGRALANAYANSFDAGEPDAWVEAIGRGGDPAVLARAMATLADDSAQADWREVFAVRVLGAARHAAAVGVLVDKYLIDADVLREDVSRALVRIGTAAVVDRLVAFYPGQRWDVRLYADDPLTHIKRPDSEAGLLRLLEVERGLAEHPDDPADDDGEPLVDHVLNGLVELCSLAGHDATLDLVADDPEHPEVLEVCEGLIASAVMAGVALPEEPVWRRRLARYESRVAQRVAALGTLGRDVRDTWRRSGVTHPSDGGGRQHLPSARPAAFAGLGDDRPNPIRRDPAKVGRNDPCPCGSGKKHKKCCGAPQVAGVSRAVRPLTMPPSRVPSPRCIRPC